MAPKFSLLRKMWISFWNTFGGRVDFINCYVLTKLNKARSRLTYGKCPEKDSWHPPSRSSGWDYMGGYDQGITQGCHVTCYSNPFSPMPLLQKEKCFKITITGVMPLLGKIWKWCCITLGIPRNYVFNTEFLAIPRVTWCHFWFLLRHDVKVYTKPAIPMSLTRHLPLGTSCWLATLDSVQISKWNFLLNGLGSGSV